MYPDDAPTAAEPSGGASHSSLRHRAALTQGLTGELVFPFRCRLGALERHWRTSWKGMTYLHPRCDCSKQTQSPYLISVRSVPVDRSTKLTAGPCMGHREIKNNNSLKAQSDCAVKARAVHQRCHIKRVWTFQSLQRDLGFYRRLNLTISFPTVRHRKCSCKGTSYQQSTSWISTERKLQWVSQISLQFLIINYKEQQNYRSRKLCFLLFHGNPLKLLHSGGDLNSSLVIK